MQDETDGAPPVWLGVIILGFLVCAGAGITALAAWII